MLKVFWDSHNATADPWSRQYASIVFYHNDYQRILAIKSKEHEEYLEGSGIVTEIVPLTEFFVAEDYHQKYYLRHESILFQELSVIYPDINDFINSTAVARLNGYSGGYGATEVSDEELNTLGLSEAGQAKLLEIMDGVLVPGYVPN